MYNPEIIQYIDYAFLLVAGVALIFLLWSVGNGLVAMRKYGSWGRYAAHVVVSALYSWHCSCSLAACMPSWITAMTITSTTIK